VDGADDLQLAFDASDLAADLALAYFESGVSATPKADGTPVTEADRAVERLLREMLSGARPEDALLGEELGQLGESDRVWIIDPVTARRSSVGVTRTGEFTSRWRLPGPWRSRSSPLLRCDAAGGRPEAAALSSRPGHARRPSRGASK
jgi:hypothetical protein